MGVEALRIVNKFFPKVKDVVDATKSVDVEVTSKDTKTSARRNHGGCAMAVACKREFNADGIIISTATAYIVKGKKAIRYRVPESVSREIISFDRNAYFEPGVYRLNKPSPTSRLGARSGSDKATPGNGKKRNGLQHITGGIRTTLKEN